MNSFLEIDEDLMEGNLNEQYKDKSIYILHYPFSEEISYSLGTIKNIGEDNFSLFHSCSTGPGSSGSPIMNLLNYKVLGLHKGAHEKRNIIWEVF